MCVSKETKRRERVERGIKREREKESERERKRKREKERETHTHTERLENIIESYKAVPVKLVMSVKML